GVIHAIALGTYELEHEVARVAAAASLADHQRRVLQGRIASALELRGASAATLAAHWSQASGPDAAARTVQWAEAAGDDAMRDFDPAVAARWFEQAIGAADDSTLRTRLVVRLAQAQCYAGDSEHVVTLMQAMRLAREIGDPELLVEAARIWAPAWSRV